MEFQQFHTPYYTSGKVEEYKIEGLFAYPLRKILETPHGNSSTNTYYGLMVLPKNTSGKKRLRKRNTCQVSMCKEERVYNLEKLWLFGGSHVLLKPTAKKEEVENEIVSNLI